MKKEITLKDQTKALFDECDKTLMAAINSAGISISNISEINDDTVILIKKYFDLMKKAEDLAIAQAEKLDQLDRLNVIEEKLDKLDQRLAQFKVTGKKEGA